MIRKFWNGKRKAEDSSWTPLERLRYVWRMEDAQSGPEQIPHDMSADIYQIGRRSIPRRSRRRSS